MPSNLQTLQLLGLDQTIPTEVNQRVNGALNRPEWDANYNPCPEALASAHMPEGEVITLRNWRATQVYAGTERDIRIYLPNVDQLPADGYRVLVCSDGPFYLAKSGPVRATKVLDTLHAQGEIEPTIGIFLPSGRPDHPVAVPIESYGPIEAQRSLEYDQLSADYGEFVFGEVLPYVAQHCAVSISIKPQHRTMCGISSGALGGFMAAWHHPDQCQRVISHCGSYTDIWGGHNVPSLLRQKPRKPIRVFLQSGENDANTPFGNWPLANQAMASALDWAGYDFRFEFGVGGHNLHHAGSIFADTLRWSWRED